jgi:hypothetical protein
VATTGTTSSASSDRSTDAVDVADVAEVRVGLACCDELRVGAGDPGRARPRLGDQTNEPGVDLAEQDVPHGFEHRSVGDPPPVDELRPQTETLGQLRDLWSATVDDHDVEPDRAQQRDVRSEGGLHRARGLALTDAAADLDDDRAVSPPGDPGQRLPQHARLVLCPRRPLGQIRVKVVHDRHGHVDLRMVSARPVVGRSRPPVRRSRSTARFVEPGSANIRAHASDRAGIVSIMSCTRR